MRVDYHLHTWASHDARSSTAEVLERALAAGLGMVVVTDHDTIEGAVALAAAAPRALHVVVGCEFTCDDGTHVIGVGLRDMIGERRLPHLLDAIRAHGAQVLLPHPFRRGSGIFRAERRRSESFVRDVLARTDLLEAFNGRDTFENNARSHDLALRAGLPSVAGSDAHRTAEIGRTCVEYAGAAFVHGASPRRIRGAPRPPRPEHPLKRRLMELYHANAGRLPGLDAAYRALRARFHADGPPLTSEPRIVHDLPALSAPSPALARGEAGAGRDVRGGAAGRPLPAPPRAGGGGEGQLAG
ncbi:MAG TPA: PHP domain-containing protein [Anaeromyxobacter sp.]|nr:PHP domain-containing protein [Anaeromyxobacter sp.]